MCIFFGFIDLFIFKIGGVPVCSGDWDFFAPQQFFGSIGIPQCLSLPGVFQHFWVPQTIFVSKKWQKLDELQCVILGNHHHMPKCRFISFHFISHTLW
jgi:hypothetical protein